MKRFLSLILALALILSCVPAVPTGVQATGANKCGENVTYTLSDDGVLTISGTGATDDYESASDAPWYGQRTSVTAVIVEAGVTALGDRAFYNCTALKSVTLACTLQTIGAYTFQGASTLQVLTIPAAVTEIKASALRNCSSLTQLIFEGNAPTLGTNTLNNTAAELEIFCNEGTTGWDDSLWSSYPITALHLGQWVVELEPTCTTDGSKYIDCSYCNTRITEAIPQGHIYNDSYCTVCGEVEILATGACGDNVRWELTGTGLLTISGTGPMQDFYANDVGQWQEWSQHIQKVVIEHGVTTIGDFMFGNDYSGVCINLTSVTIPSSITTIGHGAFEHCAALTDIVIPNSVTTIEPRAFSYCTSLTGIHIPDSVTYLGNSSSGNYMFQGCTNLVSVTLPDSLDKIGAYMFYDCSSLKTLSIPEGVTSIDSCAFSGCTALETLTLPDSVTYLGRMAFYNCSALKQIKIPDGVQTISSYAFAYCKQLTQITMPESIQDLQSRAFYQCSGLVSIALPANLTIIEENTFRDCPNIQHIYYTGTETQFSNVSIGSNNNFSDAKWHYNSDGSQLKDHNVTTCTIQLLYQCDECGDVLYNKRFAGEHKNEDGFCTQCAAPEGLQYTFSGKEITITGYTGQATHLQVPSTLEGHPVTATGYSAFPYCFSLESVILPDSITTLGPLTFYACSNLKQVTLPKNITVIPYSAFYNCSKLENIYLPTGVTVIEDHAFYYCTTLKSVRIPSAVTSIESQAFFNCPNLSDIFYGGTEAQRNNITVGTNNQLSRRWHYEVTDITENGQPAYQCGTCHLRYYQDTTLVPLQKLEIKNLPDQIVDPSGDIRLGDAYLVGTYSDGTTATIEITEAESIVADLTNTGKQTVTVTLAGAAATCNVYVHSTDSSGNEYHPPVTDPATMTCTQPGLTEGSHCQICGKILVEQEFVDSLGHSFIAKFNWSDDHAACTATLTCQRCGDVQTLDCAVTHSRPQDSRTTHAASVTYAAQDFTDVLTCDNYVVSFLDWEGNVFHWQYCHLGDPVSTPDAPERPADHTNTYTFAGWDRAIVPCEGYDVYQATYTSKTYIYAGGSGTAKDPYLIETAQQLDKVRLNLDAHFKLCSDITFTAEDFSSGDFCNSYYGWLPIGSDLEHPFTGSFDGNGKTISGYRQSPQPVQYTYYGNKNSHIFAGLFGAVVGGKIFDLQVENSKITIENLIEKTGLVYAGYIAGIVAFDNYSETVVENCHSVGNTFVSTYRFGGYAGGIVGYAGDTVNTVYPTGTIRLSNLSNRSDLLLNTDNPAVGGIAGMCATLSKGNIFVENCWNTGNISTLATSTLGLCGGIVGDSSVRQSGSIEICNCFSACSIDAKSAGGIIGHLYTDGQGINTVSNCYTLSQLPVVHTQHNSTVTDCYTRKDLDATVLTQKETFAGWDFDTVWMLEQSGDYPYPQLRENQVSWKKEVVNLQLESLPKKLVYLGKKEALDLTGGMLEVTYNNHLVQTIPLTQDMVSGFDNTVPGSQFITVSYGGLTTNFYVLIRQAHVTFLNWDGSTLSEGDYMYGDIVDVPQTPVKPDDVVYSYTFTGWDQEVVPCQDDATYTATYTATYNEYLVEFVNPDGSVISSRTYHWDDPIEVPEDPVKPADNEYTYTFAGWDKTIFPCTGNATYTAWYSAELIYYTVSFLDAEGNIYSSGKYRWNEPVQCPPSPVKAEDNTFCYNFERWDQPVADKCRGNATYAPIYTPIYIDYSVTFVNADGNEISSNVYHWGDPIVVPEDPVMESSNTYAYAFTGWDKELSLTCQGTVWYHATYEYLRLPWYSAEVNGVTMEFATFDDAQQSVPAGTTLQMLCNITEFVTVTNDLTLDLSGFNFNGNITVRYDASLQVKDSQTDDFTVMDDAGYGQLTGVVVGVEPAEGYVMIREESGKSFHKLDLTLTDMTLRPSVAGIYYKSSFAGDELVAQKITRYGVALSVQAEPTANALGTLSWFEDFAPGAEANSANGTLLHSILKPGNTHAVNAENAQIPVYGRAYVLTTDGEYIFGETVSRSLRQQVELIDKMWDTLSSDQQTAMIQMYNAYQSVMQDWDISKLQFQ